NREIKFDSDWNLIAGLSSMEPPMIVRNDVAVLDMHGSAGDELRIPAVKGMTSWLYVMDGSIEVLGETLYKGDAGKESHGLLKTFKMREDSPLVLFIVNPDADITLKRNFSGHKQNNMKRYQKKHP